MRLGTIKTIVCTKCIDKIYDVIGIKLNAFLRRVQLDFSLLRNFCLSVTEAPAPRSNIVFRPAMDGNTTSWRYARSAPSKLKM
jgi:hypothetical protein